MDEAKPRRALVEVIEESRRLRKAAEDLYKAYLQIKQRIAALDRRLEPMPDGTVRVKPKE